ncbi:MAG: UDP-N-acetylmuramoyl-L-alanine--D-glutamate ligase, partial [Luteolibacter sp.]
MNLTGKHIAILGAGRSGRAAAALALREGATVSIWDTAGADAFSGVPDGVMIHPNASAEQGAKVFSDILVVSPGIDTYGTYVAAFSGRTSEVIGEVELAARFYQGRIVAITGSNGKTTTTSLT